jgi:RHS repeat-associated protein
MPYSITKSRRKSQFTPRVIIGLIILTMALPVSPAQAEVVGKRAGNAVGAGLALLRDLLSDPTRTGRGRQSQSVEDSAQRAARVARVSLCPRRMLMYTGEVYTLSPLPLDLQGQPVHGVVFTWESSDKQVVEVASNGSVTALKAGQCVVTSSVGSRTEQVLVEVRDGARPSLTNEQWEAEHANDCTDPEQSPVDFAGRPQPLKPHGDVSPSLVVDPDDVPNVGGAGNAANATGHPRFAPNLALQSNATGTDNQLGSYNFNLSIPIFGSGGRGVGVGLSLVYNSRLWTKDGTKMVFDYDHGWPAPGFRLNYGRIVPNYNAPSGLSGDYLLIEADGTRIPLVQQSPGKYLSQDGQYIEYDITNPNDRKLTYPDGTLVRYILNGPSKIVPQTIEDINGNSITIDYVTNCNNTPRVIQPPCSCGTNCVKAPRQAIKSIKDTLGRFITFYYYDDGNLAEIRGPGYSNGPERVLAKFSYETRTISYSFGTMTVQGVPANNQVDMLKRVFFPETGRGYVFSNFSGYGMFKKASMRLGMTDSGDGTEVAYTEYTLLDSGTLTDCPGFDQRKEWWEGKTDDDGNPLDSTNPAIYTYVREMGSGTMTNKVSGPNQTRTEMTSNNDSASNQYGTLTTHKVINTNTSAVLFQQEHTYSVSSSQGGLQRSSIDTLPDASDSFRSRVEMIYGQYGRLMEQKDYGFRHDGNFRARRRTVYTYLDGSSYSDKGLLQLVTKEEVFDNIQLNAIPGDDQKIARTEYSYDENSDSLWSLETYGFTDGCQTPACTPPPGFNTGIVGRIGRGNITTVKLWSDASTTNPDITYRHRYDIFGNEVKAEVGCCSLKRSTFEPNTAGLFYSAPKSSVDGPIGGANLTTTFNYDFNTSFLTSQTDPQGRTTSYAPDGAVRLKTVTLPKLSTDPSPNNAKVETFFPADPLYANKDGLLYQTKVTYREADGQTERVIVSNQWLDGAGRVRRAGTGEGATPSSFDVVKRIYDELGRLRKSTNPYRSTRSDGDTNPGPPNLPNATTYDYDVMGRVRTVTLPDTRTVVSDFTGVETTVTDQVGRKRKSELDGLGRVIRVTEQDPSSGSLSWITNYTYDMLDNLKQVDQGGQLRTFGYDALSRMTSESTPEGGALSYTYTSFGAVLKRTDARNVETHYRYDTLNRLDQVSYTGPGGGALPSGVETTSLVSINYNIFTGQQSGNGLVSFITDGVGTDGAGREDYAYDGLSRATSKQRTVDGNVYTTGYEYNQASQVVVMVYPSGKRVRMNHDSRGRMAGLDKVNISGQQLLGYLSNLTYNEAGQLLTSTLGTSTAINESYNYNADRLQLTGQTATRGTTQIMSLGYSYQAVAGQSGAGTTAGNSGQLMSITGTLNGQTRAQSFTYDNVGRLVTATGYQVWERRFDYDRFGNRTGVWDRASGGSQIQSVAIQTAGSIPTNRISTVNSVSYVYDSSGNLTSDGVRSYQYDAESRLVKVDNGSTATYSYDAANQRVKKQTASGVTYYIWEGSQVIAEYSNVAQGGGGGLRYYLADRLSTRAVLDGAGNVIGTQDSQPFGEEGLMSAGEVEKHRFTSYERDGETGTDYAINRQYQNSTGRFMRPDPESGLITNPQSWNRYAYVRNDPVNSVDPLGLFTTKICTYVTSGVIGFFSSSTDGRTVFNVVATVDLFSCRSVGFREPPGKEKGDKKKSRRLPRPRGRATNEECRNRFDEIKKALGTFLEKWWNAAIDKHDLWVPGQGDPHYGSTWEEHIDKLNDEYRSNVKEALDSFDKGECKGRSGDPDEDKVLDRAREAHRRPAPQRPTHPMRMPEPVPVYRGFPNFPGARPWRPF